MVNPVANPAAAASAYANTAKNALNPGLDAPEQPSFGAFVKDAGLKALQTIKRGEAASADAITGNATLSQVVEAITAAELSLQTVVAVRDRAITAYQEIMRMPI